jgi:spore coat polysaccharide biosynthesis protein SpsF
MLVMRTVVVIQARMGSTRLPGKVMLPLDGEHVLTHDVRRTEAAETVDEVVVATSDKKRDDIIAWCGEQLGVDVFRGDEQNVLDRTYRAAESVDADEVVRITADCPLVDPDTIDAVVEYRRNRDVDYAANNLERTFPRGLDVVSFTFDSFSEVHSEADTSFQREHVVPYYHQNSEQFDLANVTSEMVYDESWMKDRTDLRLTLDETDDYRLLREIYRGVSYEGILDIKAVVRYVDRNDLRRMNQSVEHDP